MSQPVDLNRLRDLLNSNARTGQSNPNQADRRVHVDPSGSVVLHGAAEGGAGGEARKLSEVHQGVFAAARTGEAAIVAEKLPPSTRWIEDAGGSGWLYDIVNDLGDPYCFFVYWHAPTSLYRAMMVLPEVNGRPNVHVAHYFENGCLCLAPEIGLPTLDACYAKTVVFSLGWSTYVRVGTFPFQGS